MDDSYPLNSFDGYGQYNPVHNYRVSTPAPIKGGTSSHSKDSDAIGPYGCSQPHSSGIYVTREVMVQEASVLDR